MTTHTAVASTARGALESGCFDSVTVVAGATVEGGILPGIAVEKVTARAAIEGGILADPTEDLVLAVTAQQRVGAGAAVQKSVADIAGKAGAELDETKTPALDLLETPDPEKAAIEWLKRRS